MRPCLVAARDSDASAAAAVAAFTNCRRVRRREGILASTRRREFSDSEHILQNASTDQYHEKPQSVNRKGCLEMNIVESGRGLLALVFLCSSLSAADFRIKSEQGRIDVFEGERLVTSFHHAGKWDKPFLYPLKTPSGLVISRGYPL